MKDFPLGAVIVALQTDRQTNLRTQSVVSAGRWENAARAVIWI